jgi:hypothetical protein
MMASSLFDLSTFNFSSFLTSSRGHPTKPCESTHYRATAVSRDATKPPEFAYLHRLAHGTPVAQVSAMKTSSIGSKVNVSERVSCVLRWVLSNGASTVACEIDMDANRFFRLRIVPLCEPAAAIVQRFTNPLAAMAGHAEVACRLRDAGWVVTDRQSPATIAA